jgi:hypothetical protein
MNELTEAFVDCFVEGLGIPWVHQSIMIIGPSLAYQT